MQSASDSHSRDAAIAILRRHEASVTGYFQELMARQADAPARLVEAISYTILAGGKRLRPALVLECFHACSPEELAGRGYSSHLSSGGVGGSGGSPVESAVSSAERSSIHRESGHHSLAQQASGHHASGHSASGHSASGHHASGHHASGDRDSEDRASAGHGSAGHGSAGHGSARHGSAHHASALAAAAAMELIHNFSLVHDDLPAMDDDDLRRGRPTNHKVYGEAMAILAGDAMVSLAFEILAADAEPRLLPRLIHELAHATGPCGMIGGQALDIDPGYHPTQLPELQRLHRMKTGALLTASCRMGAIAAGADESTLSSIDSYGRHLGLAFQIVDDILDITSTPEQLGKATNKDEAKGKVTYPMLIGLEESRRQADEHLSAAIEAVGGLGDSAAGLRTLALFVVERNV